MGLPAAIAAINLIGSGVSAIQGNQNRQKAKGQIDAAYRVGRKRLDTRQGDIRRSQSESLISRGLAQGGIRLRTAGIAPTGEGAGQPTRVARESRAQISRNVQEMNRLAMTDPRRLKLMRETAAAAAARPGAIAAAAANTGAPEMPVTGARTLGEQQQLDLAREQQVEQDAMRQQRDAAKAGVDAGYAQGLIGAIGQGAAGTVDAFRLGQVRQQAEQGAFGIDPIAPWEQGTTDKFNVFTQKFNTFTQSG